MNHGIADRHQVGEESDGYRTLSKPAVQNSEIRHQPCFLITSAKLFDKDIDPMLESGDQADKSQLVRSIPQIIGHGFRISELATEFRRVWRFIVESRKFLFLK